jgi:hypothetical protein
LGSKTRIDFKNCLLIEYSLTLHKKQTMNIQAEKLELVRMILDTDNPGILSSIKRIFTDSKKVDFWDSLPQPQKDEILKGIEEIENDETVNYEQFIKKHR